MSRLDTLNLDVLKRPRVLIAFGVVLVVLLAWYFAWWSPENSKLTAVKTQETSLANQVSSLNAQLVQYREDAKIVSRYRNFLTNFSQAIPVQPDAPQLTTALSALEKTTNVNIATLDDATTVAPAPGSTLGTIPLTMTVAGSHAAVLEFVTDLYKMKRLITVQAANPSATSTANPKYNIFTHDTIPFSVAIDATAYFSG